MCVLFPTLVHVWVSECRSDRLQVFSAANRVLVQLVRGEKAPSIFTMRREKDALYTHIVPVDLYLQSHLHWFGAAAALKNCVAFIRSTENQQLWSSNICWCDFSNFFNLLIIRICHFALFYNYVNWIFWGFKMLFYHNKLSEDVDFRLWFWL